MYQTDFALSLKKFFTDYLPNERHCSPQTIDSYRFSFIHLLTYLQEEHHIPVDQVEISDITHQVVRSYLNWLQKNRSNGITTRNQRQVAINSFITFLMYEFPEFLDEYQLILQIPAKSVPKREISYVKADGFQLILDNVNLNEPNGLRDYLILTLMYTTGIRVSEVVEIRVKDLSLSEPFTLRVLGKNQKCRFVPLIQQIVSDLKTYIKQKKYDQLDSVNEFLFKNHLNEQFSRQGIRYIVKKYSKMARKSAPDMIPTKFSPHTIRHTAAMSMVEDGVDLIQIRDLLGHASVRTIEIYAKTESKGRAESIETYSRENLQTDNIKWKTTTSIKDWLKTFSPKE
jgi:site-specific recombinase XerD